MEWISTKEKLPKPAYGYRILTWNGESVELVKLDSGFYSDIKTWEKGGVMGRVTDWMECPNPPKR